MAAITQEISPYIFGVSLEPDAMKQPGFLRECENGYPDITFGLQKRPGCKYVTTLLDSSFNPVDLNDVDDAYWFAIVRDGDQPYFGCIIPATYNDSNVMTAHGTIRIWNSVTRVECTVTEGATTGPGDGAFDYLTGGSRDDYKLLTIDKVSTVLNRQMSVSVSTTNTTGTLTGTVTTYADLPASPTTDDIYQILNTGETNKDDYYVIWNGNAWVETVRPGIPDGFNNWTAPHGLRKTGVNAFTFGEANYTNRAVGDDNTNPHPSFVGQPIQDVFFYFNRLGFLSQDNVILAQPIKPDYVSANPQPVDFYNRSAQVQIASDPVDLNASSVRAIRLTSVLPAPQGLVLFSNGEQFMLYADQGVVTPLTAIIKTISNYELDHIVNPIELGDEFYFISKTPRYVRVFKMRTQGMENDPIITEVSKIASEYVPADVNNFVPNPQNQFFALSSAEQPYMWFYRRFLNNGQEMQNSWYRWKFPGNVLTCTFAKDKMYALVGTADDKCVLIQASLNKNPDEDLLTNVPNPNANLFNPLIGLGPYLDVWTSTTGVPVYDAGTNQTSIPVPTNFPLLTGADYKPCLILSQDDNLRTSGPTDAGSFTDATISGQNFVVEGDWTATEDRYVIGYKYDMIYDLPTSYYRLSNGSTDYTASLTISRYKFQFSSTGMVEFQIQGYDRTTYDDAFTSVNSEFYRANALPIYEQVTFTIPIHQRNEYFSFRIFSDSPFPSTLNKLMWEGVYTPRYYKRS